MSKRSKNKYLIEIRFRYQRAKKEEKQQILDEFCKVCSYNKKYAIRLLNREAVFKISGNKKQDPKRKYDKPEIKEFLLKTWKSSNQQCSKRLKAIIPLWLPYYQRASVPSGLTTCRNILPSRHSIITSHYFSFMTYFAFLKGINVGINIIEKKLKVKATVRNWNTVNKISCI